MPNGRKSIRVTPNGSSTARSDRGARHRGTENSFVRQTLRNLSATSRGTARVPVRGGLIGVGDRQDQRILERLAADLQSDRQAGWVGRESARHRDRGEAGQVPPVAEDFGGFTCTPAGEGMVGLSSASSGWSTLYMSWRKSERARCACTYCAAVSSEPASTVVRTVDTPGPERPTSEMYRSAWSAVEIAGDMRLPR